MNCVQFIQLFVKKNSYSFIPLFKSKHLNNINKKYTFLILKKILFYFQNKISYKTRGVKHRTTFNYTFIYSDVFKFVKSLVYCTRYYFEKKLFSNFKQFFFF